MPNANTIIQFIKNIVSEDVINQFNFHEAETSYINQRLLIVEQMDKLLSHEQCLAVMEEQGCCTTGKPVSVHREFGKKYADRSIEEKIKLLAKEDSPYIPSCRLNDDGTLSVYWSTGEAGCYTCVCGNIKKLPQPVHVSKTYCGCCGGHARQNLQKSLGTKLKLKEIVSSPINSHGEKQCEFLYEIINK